MQTNPAMLRECAKVLNRIADLVEGGCTDPLTLNCFDLAVSYYRAGEPRSAEHFIREGEKALATIQQRTAALLRAA